MPDVLNQLAKHRLLPVIVIDDADHAHPLADALAGTGLPLAEVTMRTAAAESAIRAMVKRGGLTVGAGTVLSVDLCKKALDAGAAFVVTPGFNARVVDYCLEQRVTIIPGIATCSEIELALDRGLTVVKFFPAESIGGAKALRAIAAPYSHVSFVPTGGISEKNLGEYLSIKQVLAVGGSWMVSRELLGARQFDEVARLTRSAVEQARRR